jgi:hypothetical protein
MKKYPTPPNCRTELNVLLQIGGSFTIKKLIKLSLATHYTQSLQTLREKDVQ